jgi:hypothetical protein
VPLETPPGLGLPTMVSILEEMRETPTIFVHGARKSLKL